jgi:hypothetical protein
MFKEVFIIEFKPGTMVAPDFVLRAGDYNG